MNAIEITAGRHVEALRMLRNLTSDGFSSFNGQITREQQEKWWLSMQGKFHGWLYSVDDTYVGFGLVRLAEDGLWWNSIGVHPDHQGWGYGSYITHDVLVRCQMRMYAAVRRDNPVAIAMHSLDDWDVIDGPEPERLMYFRSK